MPIQATIGRKGRSKLQRFASVWHAITDTLGQAAVRSTPEETRLDTGRSGEPLQRVAATDQRSASGPHLALLAGRAGQNRDGVGVHVRVDLDAA
jgi:hypothetical protein